MKVRPPFFCVHGALTPRPDAHHHRRCHRGHRHHHRRLCSQGDKALSTLRAAALVYRTQ